MSVKRLQVNKRMSQVVVHQGTVYLSGQVPADGSLDIAGQTRQVLAKIDGLLAEAGTNKGRLLTAQIFLKDMGDFAAMNVVWEEWVKEPGQPPSRTTIQSPLADPNFRVEITVSAAAT
jgi:enamine deaminase RidA (YjgF/YER057c/UK114 family)